MNIHRPHKTVMYITHVTQNKKNGHGEQGRRLR